jgi:hypothetical protein
MMKEKTKSQILKEEAEKQGLEVKKGSMTPHFLNDRATLQKEVQEALEDYILLLNFMARIVRISNRMRMMRND